MKFAHAYLHASFRQVRPQRQLFTGVNVWVVRLLKDLLQLLQLVAGEGGAVAPLLALVALCLALVQGAREFGARPLATGAFLARRLQIQVAALHPSRVDTRRQLGLCQAASVFSCTQEQKESVPLRVGFFFRFSTICVNKSLLMLMSTIGHVQIILMNESI